MSLGFLMVSRNPAVSNDRALVVIVEHLIKAVVRATYYRNAKTTSEGISILLPKALFRRQKKNEFQNQFQSEGS